MISKTRMLALIKDLSAKEVGDGLVGNPSLLGARDARGRNWLHLCCGVPVKQGNRRPLDAVKTARVLLDAGLDIDEEAFREGSWKATPLWFAVARGVNLPLAKFLLESSADPEHCLWAASYLDENVAPAAIALLVSHGASLDPVVEDATPFLFAVQHSRFKAARKLLELGADANFQDSRGRTALHTMLKKNSDARHFRVLLEYGARGDIRNGEGVTAAEIMARKRAPAFKKMAAQLSAA